MKRRGTALIYITVDCIFSCKYCFEKDFRKNNTVEITEQEIEDALKRFNDEGYEEVVIFGGEPLIRFDKVLHIVEHGKKYGFRFYMNTNGAMLSGNANFFNKFKTFWKDVIEKEGIRFQLEISYDGTGQSLRVWKNGESTTLQVERALELLRDNGIPFSVRYCIQSENLDCFIKDTILILEKYQPQQVLYNLIGDGRNDPRFINAIPALEYLEKRYPRRVGQAFGERASNDTTPILHYFPTTGFEETSGIHVPSAMTKK